jgi:hypothetical protein
MTRFNLEVAEQIMWEGMVEVDCTNTECDESRTIEPDGNYVCSVCGKGRLVSPLILWGMI